MSFSVCSVRDIILSMYVETSGVIIWFLQKETIGFKNLRPKFQGSIIQFSLRHGTKPSNIKYFDAFVTRIWQWVIHNLHLTFDCKGDLREVRHSFELTLELNWLWGPEIYILHSLAVVVRCSLLCGISSESMLSLSSSAPQKTICQ